MSSKNNLEIEKKFLIKYPNFKNLRFKSKIEISQSYLIRKNPEVERRIRTWSKSGVTKYFYTQKRFLTGITREEIEREISKSEHDNLKLELDTSITTVEKIRYTIDNDNLTFEIDTYPFSKELAIMEVELDNENQEFKIPKGITIIKEVTGIKRYSNISLCNAKSFPND